MNKRAILKYLRDNKDVLKISSVGRRAGISNLNHIVTGAPDGNGYPATLADKHLPALLKEIERLQIK